MLPRRDGSVCRPAALTPMVHSSGMRHICSVLSFWKRLRFLTSVLFMSFEQILALCNISCVTELSAKKCVDEKLTGTNKENEQNQQRHRNSQGKREKPSWSGSSSALTPSSAGSSPLWLTCHRVPRAAAVTPARVLCSEPPRSLHRLFSSTWMVPTYLLRLGPDSNSYTKYFLSSPGLI